jgi:WD repeat-containing protein mio
MLNVSFVSAPRQSRPCMALAWNENEPSLLAIGHDRSRTDHCIAVWDTERGAPKESSKHFLMTLRMNRGFLCIFLFSLDILHSMGLSETTHSFCWEKSSRILIAGMSHKYIKIMDFRRKLSS